MRDEMPYKNIGQRIPCETLVDIFAFFDRPDIELRIRLVCRLFNNIRQKYFEEFPLIDVGSCLFTDRFLTEEEPKRTVLLNNRDLLPKYVDVSEFNLHIYRRFDHYMSDKFYECVRHLGSRQYPPLALLSLDLYLGIHLICDENYLSDESLSPADIVTDLIEYFYGRCPRMKFTMPNVPVNTILQLPHISMLPELQLISTKEDSVQLDEEVLLNWVFIPSSNVMETRFLSIQLDGVCVFDVENFSENVVEKFVRLPEILHIREVRFFIKPCLSSRSTGHFRQRLHHPVFDHFKIGIRFSYPLYELYLQSFR